MAISVAPLAASGLSSTNNTTTYTSAAFTPTANCLLTVGVVATTTTVPSVSGHGLTWTQQASAVVGTSRMAVYTAQVGASPGSASLTFTVGSTTTQSGAWVILEVTGHDTSGTVVQAPSAGGTSTGTANVSFAAAGSADNRMLFFAGVGGSAAQVPATNWTELSEQQATSPALSLEAQWRSDATDTAASSSGYSALQWGAIGLEIKAAAATTTPVSGDVDLRWLSFTSVASSADLRWRSSVLVSGDLDARWLSYAAVSSDLDARWRVLGATTTPVSGDVDLRWRSAAQVSADLDARWRVSVRVTSDLDARWRVATQVAASFDARWRVSAAVTSDADLRWRVLSSLTQVSGSTDLRWRTYQLVPADLDLRWLSLAAVSTDVDLRWRVLPGAAVVRPNTGTTARPVGGTTVRPYTGTTTRGTGVTVRPFTTTTTRP